MSKIRYLMAMMIAILSAATVHAEQVCETATIAATTPATRFDTAAQGVVIDKDTGLMWKTCVEGLGGEDCSSGEALEMTWAGALLYVPELNKNGGFAGFTDWRIANIRELTTLAELQCANPAINLTVFPNTPVSHVWASSPYHFYTHYSWYVDFATGAPTYDERIVGKSLRLVRDATD